MLTIKPNLKLFACANGNPKGKGPLGGGGKGGGTNPFWGGGKAGGSCCCATATDAKLVVNVKNTAANAAKEPYFEKILYIPIVMALDRILTYDRKGMMEDSMSVI
jgi:hypothetical protein